ncbi:MAG: hypothetical protein WCA40_16695, partial [Candidatus Acidiferrum sp.]
MKPRVLLIVLLLVPAFSQTPAVAQMAQSSPNVQQLTLHQAEQIAIQNHPRIRAAMNLASAAKAQV